MNVKRRIATLLLAMAVVFAPMTFAAKTASAADMTFTDVNAGSWYYNAVKYVYEKNIMTGLTDTSFGPAEKVTRAMVVNVLWRMSGDAVDKVTVSPFKDVEVTKWYAKPVAWAKQKGVVGGYKDGNFGPSDAISRQDFCIILKNYAEYRNTYIKASTEDSYKAKPDADKVSGYAAEAVEWAFQRELIGQGDKLNPKGQLTRAEAAAMFMRFDQRLDPVGDEIVASGEIALGDDGSAIEWKLTSGGALLFSMSANKEGSVDISSLKEAFEELTSYTEKIGTVIAESGLKEKVLEWVLKQDFIKELDPVTVLKLMKLFY